MKGERPVLYKPVKRAGTMLIHPLPTLATQAERNTRKDRNKARAKSRANFRKRKPHGRS